MNFRYKLLLAIALIFVLLLCIQRIFRNFVNSVNYTIQIIGNCESYEKQYIFNIHEDDNSILYLSRTKFSSFELNSYQIEYGKNSYNGVKYSSPNALVCFAIDDDELHYISYQMDGMAGLNYTDLSLSNSKIIYTNSVLESNSPSMYWGNCVIANGYFIAVLDRDFFNIESNSHESDRTILIRNLSDDSQNYYSSVVDKFSTAILTESISDNHIIVSDNTLFVIGRDYDNSSAIGYTIDLSVIQNSKKIEVKQRILENDVTYLKNISGSSDIIISNGSSLKNCKVNLFNLNISDSYEILLQNIPKNHFSAATGENDCIRISWCESTNSILSAQYNPNNNYVTVSRLKNVNLRDCILPVYCVPGSNSIVAYTQNSGGALELISITK